jgi:hypothetical protein
MVESKDRLFEAVKLLDEIIDGLTVAEVSPGSEGSTRLLLIRLQRIKNLLGEFDQHEDPGWDLLMLGVLLREAARWLVEMINNIQYLRRSFRNEHAGLDRATGIRSEILSSQGGHYSEEVCPPHWRLCVATLLD